MDFGWKILLPVATINALVTAALVIWLLSPRPFDSLGGFGVTLRQIFKKPITQQYPEYKRPVYPRFRGRHRLWTHENGLENASAAHSAPRPAPPTASGSWPRRTRPTTGSRQASAHARIYEINLSLHLLWLLRARVPVRRDHAGERVRDLEYSRDDLIYTKDMLLAEPIKRVPVADRDLYDTPIPAYKERS